MALETTLPWHGIASDVRRIDIALLQREIADEYTRSEIECHALAVPSNYPAPVYDVTRLETSCDDPEMRGSYAASIARAVQYLDARGLLVRPFSDKPQLVSFGRA